MSQKKLKRPTLPERYEAFTELNGLIQDAEDNYHQTLSEVSLRMLKRANRLKELWWDTEEQYREQELFELQRDIAKYPHSVQTWFTDYREKELE